MSTSIFCVVNFAARLITTSSLKGWKTLLGRAATSLRFAMNTWTEGTVGCRWRQWELLSSNWEAKIQVFLEAPPHMSAPFYIFVRMSWNLATSTHLINGFLLSWTHLEMGNCKTFLIKSFWWETQWTLLPKMIHQNLNLQFHKGSYRKGWNIPYYSAAIWPDGLKY